MHWWLEDGGDVLSGTDGFVACEVSGFGVP